jgi:hypothetical protein
VNRLAGQSTWLLSKERHDSRIARSKGDRVRCMEASSWRLAGKAFPGPRVDAFSRVAALFLAVKDAAARLAALGPFRPSLTARPSSAG